MKKENLILHLRKEAYDVKDCFTQFSFKALTISAAFIGLIIKFQLGNEISSISALSVTILVMHVAKIGNHKYNTANRNLGFVLYMERMDSLFNTKARLENEKYDDLDNVPWEEAMRAWRIVQATVFARVYTVGPFRPNQRKWKCRKECPSYNVTNPYCRSEVYWFEPESLISNSKEQDPQYYPGGYLKAVQTILFSMALVSLFPIFLSIYRYFNQDNWLNFYFYILIAIITIIFVIWRMCRLSARRKILESGILSIHSCGILWEAVILAHRKAITVSSPQKNKQKHLYTSYTETLSKIALDLSENICDIHNWIENNRTNIK